MKYTVTKQNCLKHAYLTCQCTSLQLTDLSKLSKRSVIAWTASVEAVPIKQHLFHLTQSISFGENINVHFKIAN